MPNETLDRKQELNHQVLPDAEIDLDANGAHTERRRSTGKAQPSQDGGPVAVLWLLALLIAEIGLWLFAFAHMYRM